MAAPEVGWGACDQGYPVSSNSCSAQYFFWYGGKHRSSPIGTRGFPSAPGGTSLSPTGQFLGLIRRKSDQPGATGRGAGGRVASGADPERRRDARREPQPPPLGAAAS